MVVYSTSDSSSSVSDTGGRKDKIEAEDGGEETSLIGEDSQEIILCPVFKRIYYC